MANMIYKWVTRVKFHPMFLWSYLWAPTSITGDFGARFLLTSREQWIIKMVPILEGIKLDANLWLTLDGFPIEKWCIDWVGYSDLTRPGPSNCSWGSEIYRNPRSFHGNLRLFSVWFHLPEYNDPCLIEGLPAISLLYLQMFHPKKRLRSTISADRSKRKKCCTF